MSNTYEQITGFMYDDNGQLLGKGYSGHPPHRNDPSSEGVPNIGPIPCGTYNITAMEPNTTEHGPYVLVLSPDGPTRQRILSYNRTPDEFRVHGDEIKVPGMASQGCIVMPPSVREVLWTGPDHIIDVIDKLETTVNGT